MSFIRINNRNNFLISEVPQLHPQSLKYIQYWKRHKKRIIEGFWSQDNKEVSINVDEDLPEEILQVEDNWRYMPPNLYFYVNMGTILHKPEDSPKAAPKKRMRPLLRDIEWEFFYNWAIARGFSGFSDDENFTCNTDVLKLKTDPTIQLHKSCINSKGQVKEYINAHTYLRQLHKKPLGTPLWENNAHNLIMLGSRGFGKSFMVGVGIGAHELLTDGAKYYNQQSIENPYKVEIFVGAALSSKSADLLDKTKDCIEHLPGSWGEGTEEFERSPLFKQMVGTLSPNNMKNPWRHEYEVKSGGSWLTKGSGSNIKHGIYTVENPEAAAGTRPGIMIIEEVGLLPNALTVHGSNTACQMEGIVKFGSSIYLGTGGNVEKIQETEIIFRDPSAFDMLEFDDEWEGSGKIGWFVPAYYALNQYKDSNGNTDVEKAKSFLLKRREEKKKSKDSSALSLEMMNYPIVPSEMFLNAKQSDFPQALIKAHLAEVKSNPKQYENASWFGELEWTSQGTLQWHDKGPGNLVREFPVKNNKSKPGIIEIFEMPKRNGSGEVFPKRYLQGTDTYDDDTSNTSSLGSTFILDLWTERIVAEYTGRRDTKEFYEITRKLNIYYRTDHNYENNKKGLYTHYDVKKSTYLLCDTPESLRDVIDIKISKIGNTRKGTTASKAVNAHGLRLFINWLTEPAYGEENQEILNLHKIKSQGLLTEMINYSPSYGNYDRISAMVMLMILREEKLKFLTNKKEETVKSLSQDPFFDKHFDRNRITNKLVKFNTNSSNHKIETTDGRNWDLT